MKVRKHVPKYLIPKLHEEEPCNCLLCISLFSFVSFCRTVTPGKTCVSLAKAIPTRPTAASHNIPNVETCVQFLFAASAFSPQLHQMTLRQQFPQLAETPQPSHYRGNWKKISFQDGHCHCSRRINCGKSARLKATSLETTAIQHHLLEDI